MEEVPILLFTALLSVIVGGVYWLMRISTNITGGSIFSKKVGIGKEYNEYCSLLGNPEKLAEKKLIDLPELVETYYDAITDILEWAWGKSFHFSPSIPGKSNMEAARIQEEKAADLIKAKSGDRILDVGCGVGGPMISIANHSRANIVGITMNETQVKRAKYNINKASGLASSLCKAMFGNFLDMSVFEDESFNGAYAFESTLYAPHLEDVYREVFRVLKPGGMFVSHEEVTTNKYNVNDPEHVRVIEEIQRGYVQPPLRNYKDIAVAARMVGFEVVEERDLAEPPAGPWWTVLKTERFAYWRNYLGISLLVALGIVPSGTKEATRALSTTSEYMRRAGEMGIITPMYMILCRKPLNIQS